MTGNTPTPATGYCPNCGRGDCAPTADQYEQQRQRADRAEAALRDVLDAFEAYWARASYCGPDTSAVQPEHFQAWRGVLTQPKAATEATDIETTARVFAGLHRSAEQDVTRVIELYERWVTEGAPPLGVPMARWWDKRLVELHEAIRPAGPGGGPTVAEAAQDDRRWDLQKGGE